MQEKHARIVEQILAGLPERDRQALIRFYVHGDPADDPATREDAASTVDVFTEVRREAALLKTGALQNAIINSPNFSSIATDEKGVIQLFNVGAERMLGNAAAEVLNKVIQTRNSIFWATRFGRGDRRIARASSSSTLARQFPARQ
jgi:PAS domain-containing protein